MKKYIIFIFLISILAGCAKLDVDPTQSIAADKAIRTPDDLNQALTGCYDALQLSGFYGRHTVIAAELSSDNAQATGTILEYNDISLNNLLSNNTISEAIWSDCYIAINRVNNTLYYLPSVENLADEDKNDVEGQLLFIRSLAYYNLVRYFGDMPLKVTPTLSTDDINLPRTAVSEILAHIKDDLDFAAKNISTKSAGRAQAAAGEALLAKIARYESRWADAETHASHVIENYGLSLIDDYESLFNNEGNAESIFEVQFSDQDKNRMAEYLFPTSLGGRYEASPSEDLVNAFGADDARLAVSLAGLADKPYCNKYNQISSGADRVYVMRLAEMFLLRAEARVKQEGDMLMINDDINQIRQRAGLEAVDLQDYDALLDEILMQRRLEFSFEGQRWFDLIINDRAIQTLPNITSSNQLLFPIPFSEINTNTAIGPANQNPGY